MSINKTKRILSFLVSSILVSGNVMAVDSKTKSRSNLAPKSSLIQYALIGGSVAAVTTGVALYNKKNNTKETASPTYVSSKSVSYSSSNNYFINYQPTSYSPSNNYFINYQPTSSSPSNKLDPHMENECLYKIKLFENVFCSVWRGNILTVGSDNYKEGDKITVVTPDNKSLVPSKGSLAEAIAFTLFGKNKYPDKDDLPKFKVDKSTGNIQVAIGPSEAKIELAHAIVPCKPVSANQDDEAYNLATEALSNVYKEEIKKLIEGSYGKSATLNLPLLGAGGAGFTTTESISCLKYVLACCMHSCMHKLAKGKYICNEPLNLNLVIHPKYNTTKDREQKTDLVVKMLKSLGCTEINVNNVVEEKVISDEKPMEFKELSTKMDIQLW